METKFAILLIFFSIFLIKLLTVKVPETAFYVEKISIIHSTTNDNHLITDKMQAAFET